jgi:hypothetical protein
MPYLEASQENGRALMMRQLQGEVIMLNLLKFRDFADYSDFPDLAPSEAISGRAAYDMYIEHTLPHLRASGGDIMFMGQGGQYLIGPSDEYWDLVIMVKQQSVESFIAFASHEAYLKGIGHRMAAIIDSRILPLESLNF